MSACYNWLLQVYILIEILFVSIDASPLYQFVQVPDMIQLTSFYAEANITATKATDCIPLIKPTTVALFFTPSTNTCTSYSKLLGFNLRNTGNVYYLRMPGKCGACATSEQTKSAIISYTYQNNACPGSIFTYDTTTGYCVAKISDQVVTNANPYFTNYAAYTQGAYKNGTLLVMSRGMAAQALSYVCPFSNSTTATFNNAWYCYTQFQLNSSTPTYITQNVCGRWLSGGTALKFIHLAEPGYLSLRNGANSYTGIVLPAGASGSSNSYRYYDGTRVPGSYRVWASGRPIAQQLVYVDTNLNLVDYDASRMIRIMCRSPATAS